MQTCTVDRQCLVIAVILKSRDHRGTTAVSNWISVIPGYGKCYADMLKLTCTFQQTQNKLI